VFTVKLVHDAGVRLVAGKRVDVGVADGTGVRKISVTASDGNVERFEIGGVDGFRIAYVENAAGQTTEVVRAKNG
jgi:hypothetical protein